MTRKGRVEGISRDVHDILRKVAGSRRGVPAELHPAWQSTVGSAIARVTRPDSLHQGVLTVVTRSPVWVNELMMLQERILEGLEAALEERLVVGLRFRVGRLFDRGRDRRSTIPPPPPRELRPEIGRRLEDVRDPLLREAIRRAMSRCGES